MRISDWSSDVCSSDLAGLQQAQDQDDAGVEFRQIEARAQQRRGQAVDVQRVGRAPERVAGGNQQRQQAEGDGGTLVGRKVEQDHDHQDRRSGVKDKRESERITLGGLPNMKNKKKEK